MPHGSHEAHVRDEAVERLEHQHHTDVEGLVVQVRALAIAIEQLADAVEAIEVDAPAASAVRDHLEQARLAMKPIW